VLGAKGPITLLATGGRGPQLSIERGRTPT
jgi:hypothetical protein